MKVFFYDDDSWKGEGWLFRDFDMPIFRYAGILFL